MFNDILFTAYAAHKQSIEDFIDGVCRLADPYNEADRYYEARRANLNEALLTKYEKEYIEEQISRRVN